MSNFFVNIIARLKGTGAIAGVTNDLSAAEAATRSLNKNLAKLGGAFALGSFAKEALQISDTYVGLRNRLEAVGVAGDQLAATQQRLYEISQRSRVALSETTELYARLAVSSKELGKSTEELLAFQESLNKTIILSGANAKEAKAATVQLAQGLASGALRGDELRSVLEQLPAVADVVAKGFGVTRGELKRLGEQGEITAIGVVNAFAKFGDEIDNRFNNTQVTVGQALEKSNNRFEKFIDTLNQTADGTGGLTFIIETLSSVILDNAIEAISVFDDLMKQVGKSFIIALDSAESFGAFLLNFAQGGVLDPFKLIGDAYFGQVVEAAKAEAALAQVGAQIVSVNKEIRTLQASADKGSETAKARIIELQKQLEVLKGRAAEATQLKKTKEQLLEEEKLAAIKERQKDVFEAIVGKQEDITKKAEAANQLYYDGQITTEELYDYLLKIKDAEGLRYEAARKAREEQEKVKASLNEQLNRLQEANAIEGIRQQQGEVAANLEAVRLEYKKQGLDLTQAELAAFEEQFLLQQKLADSAKTAPAAKAADPTIYDETINRVLELTEIQGNQLLQEQALNDILALRPDLYGEVVTIADEINLKTLEASVAFEDGFSRALLKLKKEGEDLAAVGEQITDVFVNGLADGLTEFLTQGELDFKKFASTLLQEITRILVRLLVAQAISAALGGGAPVPGANIDLAGARAEGGPVTGNRSYLVGENGPEIFTPGAGGNITPNEAIGGKPEVKLQVVNVTDPNQVRDAIVKGGADQAILNVLQRNKDTIKATLG